MVKIEEGKEKIKTRQLQEEILKSDQGRIGMGQVMESRQELGITDRPYVEIQPSGSRKDITIRVGEEVGIRVEKFKDHKQASHGRQGDA